MTIKSKAWIDFSMRIDDILHRMYDTDAVGNPLHNESPELLDPINRIVIHEWTLMVMRSVQYLIT
jgi:hypothetical protein